MPLSDRDYIKGEHPPNCTCVECTNKRLGKNNVHLDVCPKCYAKSVWYNNREKTYECLNPKCKIKGRSLDEIRHIAYDRYSSPEDTSKASENYPKEQQIKPSQKEDHYTRSNTNENRRRKGIRLGNQNWLKALLLVVIVSLAGLGISIYIGIPIPFWTLLGFSIIFSIEKWFNYFTRKQKTIGKLYRLLLNLSILSLLGIVIWSGIKLFSRQFIYNQLVGILIFIAELIFFIWMWRIVSKNSWRWPSMKLTVFSIFVLFLILAFAGVAPMETYKDASISFLSSKFSNSTGTSTVTSVNKSTPLAVSPSSVQASSSTPVKTSPVASLSSAITPGLTSNIDRSAFQSIDQYAIGTPDSAAKSVNVLANYLIQPAKNDFEKTRAIYRWITQNISYDFSAYLTGRYGSTNAVDVLVSRSSVCQGYSSLFNALAKSAGLEVVTITGWAKGYSYTAGDQITGPTNHAWNGVKINGGWYLIDSTWSAGSIIQQRFVRDFDESYFLTPPNQFIYNHLPEDSKWQLLSTPFSKSDFSALPYVHSDFFKYGLNLGSNTQSVVNAKGSLSMTFPVPNDTYLMARISQGNVELPETYTSARRSGNQCLISATFPNPGTYTLSIYARKGGEFGTYDGVLEYKVLAGTNP
ncbi:MAG: transglutaminase domain-containing protein [Dehalococcoidales bacterium]|nr:transglutaminase domain-containing protein [Dehalococcoidales bacterium]